MLCKLVCTCLIGFCRNPPPFGGSVSLALPYTVQKSISSFCGLDDPSSLESEGQVSFFQPGGQHRINSKTIHASRDKKFDVVLSLKYTSSIYERLPLWNLKYAFSKHGPATPLYPSLNVHVNGPHLDLIQILQHLSIQKCNVGKNAKISSASGQKFFLAPSAPENTSIYTHIFTFIAFLSDNFLKIAKIF